MPLGTNFRAFTDFSMNTNFAGLANETLMHHHGPIHKEAREVASAVRDMELAYFRLPGSADATRGRGDGTRQHGRNEDLVRHWLRFVGS